MLPREVRHATARYLRAADRLVPGQVLACYLVGSTALRAYRPGRSDLDLVAVLADGPLTGSRLQRRLRALHLAQLPVVLAGAARSRRLHATCNVSFVPADQMALPVTAVEPVASHVGARFVTGVAFDVNPVQWQVLAERGVTLRGRAPGQWGLDPERGRLRNWNLENLRTYWTAELARVRTGSGPMRPGAVEWCVLGPLRLHATIATGQILSKDEAGAYGQQLFGDESGILETARAVLAGTPVPARPRREDWRELTAQLMDRVIRDAHSLARH